MKKSTKNIRFSTDKSNNNDLKSRKRIRLSTKDRVPFKELYDNGLILADYDEKGREVYTIVAMLENINYSLLKDSNKQKIIDDYARLFNSLPQDIHYQEMYINIPYDTKKLYNIVTAKNKEGDPAFTKAYNDIQKGFVDKVVDCVSDMRIYVALSYTVRTKADNPYNILSQTFAKCKTFYDSMGVKSYLLPVVEFLSVMYNIYNPYDIDGLKLPNDIYGRGLDIKDYILPSYYKRENRQIRIGGSVTRCFYVSSYSDSLDDEFLYKLMANKYRIVVSKHIDHISKASAVDALNKELRSYESDRQTRNQKNKQQGTTYIPYGLEDKIRACTERIEALQANEEMFGFGLYVMVSADNDEMLDEISSSIVGIGAQFGVKLSVALVCQEDVLNTCAPVGVNYMTSQIQDFMTTGVSITVPFSYSRYVSEGGYYYGKNTRTNSPIMLNRKDYKNGNAFYLAKTGGGKSFLAKLEITDTIQQTKKDRVYIIDPEAEFVNLTDTLNGTVIRVSPSTQQYINPFDIVGGQQLEDDVVKSKADLILSIFAVFKDEKLSAQEKSVVDRCTSIVYRDFVMHDYDEAYIPTFVDFAKALQNQPEPEAKDLYLYLEMYVTGTVNMFAHKTNVDLSSRIICFDVSGLNQNIKKVGMLILLDFIQNQFILNYQKGVYSWLYADEFHLYYSENEDNNSAGKFFERVFARCRKYGGMATGITQNATSVLKSDTALGMLQNSNFVVLLEQDGQNIDVLSSLYDLSPEQRGGITSPNVGEGLIITQKTAIPFNHDYPKDNIIYQTITTDFKDRIKKLEGASL